MKQRLADYVADFAVSHGVHDVFSVVGGGAMHLNDAFGHREELHVTYQHHEQACAIAAEAYARIENKIALVCVTSGPGGTNALTGVLGGWLDSIPMMILSGQVRYDTTARYEKKLTGAVLRAEGDQEFDITKAATSMCKYANMLERPEDIRYMLEKAWYLAVTGRPGPVWIDIPVNYQGTYIETDELQGFQIEDNASDNQSENVFESVVKMLSESKRPVIYAGYGIRLAGAVKEFRQMVEELQIPIVTYWNSIDLIEDENPQYAGRAGNMGDRPGNFAVQNADCLLTIGTRISIRQVGYNWKSWARAAKVIMVDIDENELKKHTIHVDTPICMDAKEFITGLNKAWRSKEIQMDWRQWNQTCQNWRQKYPTTTDKHWAENGHSANVYAFIRYLSSSLPQGSVTAVSNGACCVVGHQNYVIQKNSRFIINSAVASMGYGLPAAIGACKACGNRAVVCLEGDGSLMMNLQELQTVVTNRLPVKLFVINNQGYHSIRITQNNLFSEHDKVGIGPESGDLSFPQYRKIAEAFGYPYYEAHSNNEMKKVVDQVLKKQGYAFCEIFTDTLQVWEPKSSTKRLEDGTLVSPPLEDLAPFLSREELEQNMFIPLWEDV